MIAFCWFNCRHLRIYAMRSTSQLSYPYKITPRLLTIQRLKGNHIFKILDLHVVITTKRRINGKAMAVLRKAYYKCLAEQLQFFARCGARSHSLLIFMALFAVQCTHLTEFAILLEQAELDAEYGCDPVSLFGAYLNCAALCSLCCKQAQCCIWFLERFTALFSSLLAIKQFAPFTIHDVCTSSPWPNTPWSLDWPSHASLSWSAVGILPVYWPLVCLLLGCLL